MTLTLRQANRVAERLSRGLVHADVRVQKFEGTYAISVLVDPATEIGFEHVHRVATVYGLTAVAKSGGVLDEFLVLEED